MLRILSPARGGGAGPLSDTIWPAIVGFGVPVPGSRKRRCSAGFLKLCLAGKTFYTTNSFPEVRKAATRQTLSFELRSSEMVMIEVKVTLTYILSVPLEAAPIALPVGLANISRAPYEVDGTDAARDGRLEQVQDRLWVAHIKIVPPPSASALDINQASWLKVCRQVYASWARSDRTRADAEENLTRPRFAVPQAHG